jgi:hypothetical protein
MAKEAPESLTDSWPKCISITKSALFTTTLPHGFRMSDKFMGQVLHSHPPTHFGFVRSWKAKLGGGIHGIWVLNVISVKSVRVKLMMTDQMNEKLQY